ncbi:MAG TPA: hypothetical protein VMQ67_08645, partial [Candidatus Saccharimonadales bacterium]|nr:hypothetical protein [Candidatus Saccharimonadales bacterium]
MKSSQVCVALDRLVGPDRRRAPDRARGTTLPVGVGLAIAVFAIGIMAANLSAGQSPSPASHEAAHPQPDRDPFSRTGTTISFDGEAWLTAPDPSDVGRDQGWYLEPRPP